MAAVEDESGYDADASRKEVRKLIEAVYTLPASTGASASPPK